MAAEKVCTACQSRRMEAGKLICRGFTETSFMPDAAPRTTRWFAAGSGVAAHVCLDCGHLQLSADVDELLKVIGGDHTRCRHCRYILRGITEPRCPECGEPI